MKAAAYRFKSSASTAVYTISVSALDVTAIVNEYYGDTSRMFNIGKISVKAKNLIDAVKNVYWPGRLQKIKNGVLTGKIKKFKDICQKIAYST